ncbi:cation diffusion facilitator family transporter [Crenothrix polyspora]|uniref:Cation diffusion facilitator family transporter n=1 Tax=Crenothrix polyspora TaxID=360316 RepID=A0A1R4HG55_9GAMM|nr:cation diffusion facilitator family transporter [Crenothrix polyspora]SJM95204.1 Cation diffusion facilitator family transporter [Crenothrix polyspora]
MSATDSSNASITAILYAFSANLAIAIAKTGIALWTGSGSLLAEAIHSYADCSNQILLFIGLKRSAKEATRKHPMGYGRESYIWSMMVAVILFSIGGVFSVHEGWLRYNAPHAVENAGIALVVLLIAVVMEAFSLKGATDAMQSEKAGRSMWQWFRETHSSELMVIVGEDIAALIGLVIALITLGLTMLTGNVAYDAVGSILIGVLLIVVATLIGIEVHSLLIGETEDDIRAKVEQYLESQPSVVKVLNIWAINHGKAVMLTIKAEFKPEMTVLQAVNDINAMEKQIKATHTRIKWVFFELDNAD